MWDAAAYLVPYETLAFVNGQNRSKSTSTAAGLAFLCTESRLWWRGLNRISDLVLRVHRPALALDVLHGTVGRVIGFLRFFRRRRRLMTLDGGRGGVGVTSIILIVFGAGIIPVVVLIVVVVVIIILITAFTIGRTVVAVLVVELNLLITGPGGWRGCTT